MKKLVLGCLFGVAGALAACSSSTDPCATYYAASTQYATAYTPCIPMGFTVPTDGGTLATCDAILAGTACTSADKTALQTQATNYQTCVTAAGTCSTADAGAFLTAFTACTSPIFTALINGDAGVTSACFAAVTAPGGI